MKDQTKDILSTLINDKSPDKAELDPFSVTVNLPETLPILLKSKEPEVIFEACVAIDQFVRKSEANAKFIVENGAILDTIELLRSKDPTIRLYGSFLLAALSKCRSGATEVINKNGIPLLKHLLQNDTGCDEFTLYCLSRICRGARGKVDVYEQDIIPLIFEKTSSPDPDIVQNALMVLFLLFEDYKARQSCRDPMYVKYLMDQLEQEHMLLKKTTLNCLNYLVEVRELHSSFRGLGCIRTFMNLLLNQDMSDLHQTVTSVLSKLFDFEDNVEEGLAIGITNIFATQVFSTTFKTITKYFLVKLMGKLLLNNDCRRILFEMNIEEPIYVLLSTADEPDSIISVTEAVGHLAMFSLEKRVHLATLGAFPIIVANLKSTSYDVKLTSLTSIYELLKNSPDNAVRFAAAQGFEPLVSCLDFMEDRIIMTACLCLCEISYKMEYREECVHLNVLTSLMRALKLEVIPVKIQIFYTLAAYSLDNASKEKILSLEIIPKILSLITTADKELLKAGLCFVRVLCNHPALCVEILRHEGLMRMRKLSKKDESGLCQGILRKLLEYDLPAKYTILGYLESTDNVGEGFYDVDTFQNSHFPTLDELLKEPLNLMRPIYLINPKKYSSPNKFNEYMKQDTVDMEKKNRNTTKGLTPKAKVGKYRKSRSLTEFKDGKESSIHDDYYLFHYCTEIKNQIITLESDEDKFSTIARYVSDALGGPLPPGGNIGWQKALQKVMVDLDSNVLPLGQIRLGHFNHRALLFKFLCSSVELKCSLWRNDLRSYNEVYIASSRLTDTTRRYVIDLMFEPGKLMDIDSEEAIRYIGT